MEKSFAMLRWSLGLRGMCAIGLGMVFIWPGISAETLAAAYAAYAVASGSLLVAGALTSRLGIARWPVLGAGLSGLAIGAAAYASAGSAAPQLMLLIAINESLCGASQLALAFQLRRFFEKEWMLVFAGCLSTSVGILMALMAPVELRGAVRLMGGYTIVAGALLLTLGVRPDAWSARSLPAADAETGRDLDENDTRTRSPPK